MRERVSEAMRELVGLARQLQEEEGLSEAELEDLLEQELAEALGEESETSDEG